MSDATEMLFFLFCFVFFLFIQEAYTAVFWIPDRIMGNKMHIFLLREGASFLHV